MLIALADVIIVQIKVGLLRDLHTGMPQNLAQRENIHAIHQTTLGKIVPQAVRGVFLIQSTAAQILLEVAFKVADLNAATTLTNWKQKITFRISILELDPTAQDAFCLLRKDFFRAAFPALNILFSMLFAGNKYLLNK